MRSVDPAHLAQLRNSGVRVWFIQIDYYVAGSDNPDIIQYYSTATQNLNWAGHTWLGVGKICQIDPIEETETMEPLAYRISIPLVNQADLAIALNGNVRGGKVLSYEARFDPSTKLLLGQPALIDEGTMDVPEGIDGPKECRVAIVVDSDLADFSRPRVLRYTNADQQRMYHGDTSFQYAAQMPERSLAWPSREAQL